MSVIQVHLSKGFRELILEKPVNPAGLGGDKRSKQSSFQAEVCD